MGLFQIKRIAFPAGVIAVFAAWGLLYAQWSIQVDPTGSMVRFDSISIGLQGSARIRLAHAGTENLDPPSIATVTRGSVTFTITGAAAGDIVVMLPPAALNDDLLYVGAAVTAGDTVSVYLFNDSAAPIDDGPLDWGYLYFDTT